MRGEGMTRMACKSCLWWRPAPTDWAICKDGDTPDFGVCVVFPAHTRKDREHVCGQWKEGEIGGIPHWEAKRPKKEPTEGEE